MNQTASLTSALIRINHLVHARTHAIQMASKCSELIELHKGCPNPGCCREEQLKERIARYAAVADDAKVAARHWRRLIGGYHRNTKR